MTFLTKPGDIAGLMLLAAGIVTVVARAAAIRITASRPAQPAPSHHGQHARAQHSLAQRVPAQRVPAQRVPAQRVAPRAPIVAIPAQSTWQSRGLVEDRVPGPAALELEEAVGPGDQ
jgi:hypothetical protein